MSERMTSIHLPGQFGCGWAEWGRKSVPEMIEIIRNKARYDLKIATEILNALDDDFRIETYLGVHAHKNVQVLQEGRSPPAEGEEGDGLEQLLPKDYLTRQFRGDQ